MRMLLAIMIAITLGASSFGAYAAWKCQTSNMRGQSWYGVGPTRGAAASYAIQLCRSNSWHGGRSCRLDFCRPISPGYGRWHCTAVGARGGLWEGMGMSQPAARSMALRTCYMHSPRCFIRGCYMR